MMHLQTSEEVRLEQSELFRPFISRVSEQHKNNTDELRNEKDMLDPYAREFRASRATM